jgi:putative SOS response-associated peptidase YedK
MCGKFTQMASWRQVYEYSMAFTPSDGALSAPGAADDTITATPMRMASIIYLDATGQRQVQQMRWGFADLKASNPNRPKHMHARAETIDKLPTFRDSFEHRRGILLVKTFNEGEELPSGKTKQWVITPKDGAPVALAVIYEEWIRDDVSLLTFIQVTTPANPLITPVTDRMPAVLRPKDWSTWLGENNATPAEAKALLQTYDDGGGWEIAPQAAPSKAAKAKAAQGALF